MTDFAQRNSLRTFLILSALFAIVSIGFLAYEIFSIVDGAQGGGMAGEPPSLQKRQQAADNLSAGAASSSASIIKMNERQKQISNMGSGKTLQTATPSAQTPQQSTQLDAKLKVLDSLNAK